MIHDVCIVGGGLAGSAAAIKARQAGLSVCLIEKSRGSRQKLCGEFLSPEGRSLLEHLGVLERLEAAGATTLERVRIANDTAEVSACIPGGALGISRNRLDAICLDEAYRQGAHIVRGHTVKMVDQVGKQILVCRSDDRIDRARFVVVACGRSSRLVNMLQGFQPDIDSPYVAFKAHYRGLDLGKMIEMFPVRGGYCGMSMVEGELVNMCWIADKRLLQEAGGDPRMMLELMGKQNTELESRCHKLDRVDPAFCAASQLTFRPRMPVAGQIFFAGDSAGMIAPLCGDGMSMAIQSGIMAARIIAGALDGAVDDPQKRYKTEWLDEYSTRMRWGRWFHNFLVRPYATQFGMKAMRRLPGILDTAIRVTRGSYRMQPD